MSNEHGRINRLQEVEDLTEYINNGWLHSGESDGPTFLWNDMIREASQEDAENRNNVPVAQLSDADMVISMPMQWYFDSIAAMVPTAERTDTGVEIPRIDMPTFHLDSQALSGVDAVVGNAIVSTRWLDAVGNLAKAVEMTARFVGNVADRDNEGFDYLKDLIQTVRVYMDAVACNANPMTGEQALNIITQVACNEDFRLNAMQMVELLSCGLSFAQWDDTRMFAYDALNKGFATMSDFASSASRLSNSADDSDSRGMQTDSQSVAQVKTDLGLFEDADSLSAEDLNNLAMLDPALLSEKEIAQAAQNQFDHAVQFHTSEPLADAYAARLIAAERWQDLLDFVDLVLRDKPNQVTMMFPEEVVPYEWETIREAALEALGRSDELVAMYQERLDDTYDPNTALNHLKLHAWLNQQ